MPEPEPEVAEDVCEVSLDKKAIRCGGAIPGRITEVMEEEFGVTAAGAGGDEEDELDDDL